jgi:hypothetical protein
MDEQAMRDALERDKSIVELRALLASYEERLSRTSDRIPDSHAARAHFPEPLFLLNDIAVDLRSSDLDSSQVIEAPAIIDCFKPDQPEPFSFVYKVTNGVFRVHPRQDKLTAAVIGPFTGPPPTGLVATAQTTHGAAPTVRFHLSTWLGEIDPTMIEAKFGDGQVGRFLTIPPRHQGFLVATDCPQPPAAAPESPWGLLLATIADPPDEVSHAWAEFSDIVLIFSGDSGTEVRLLS